MAVAERFGRACARVTLARLDGNEFVILQTALPEPREAHALAESIVRVASEPYDIEGKNS